MKMPADTVFDLIILSGPQAGACISLTDYDELTLGDDMENDIYLRDDAVSGSKIKLRWLGSDLILQVINGSVYLDSVLVSEKMETVLAPYSPVQMGGTLFAYGEPDHARWDGISARIQSYSADLLTDAPDTEDTSANKDWGAAQDLQGANNSLAGQAGESCSVFSVRTFISLGVGMLVTYLLMLLMHDYTASAKSLSAYEQQLNVQMELLNNFMQQNEYVDIEYYRDSDDRLSLQGYITRKSDLTRLEDFISSQDLKADMAIDIGEILSGLVRDTFRLNDIVAEVSLVERGVVAVQTTGVDAQVISRIEQITLQDIPQLKKLNIVNTPPATEKEIIKKKPEEELGEIIMVAPGSQAYVVMHDLSKHSVGATLPGGYKITRILIDRVYFDKSGKEIVVGF